MKKKGPTKKQAIAKLWDLGDLSYKLKGIQLEMREMVYNAKLKVTPILVSRQSGKCMAEGSEIITTQGMKKIEDIKVGDYVYGVNEDGTTSPARVNDVMYQGEKEVIELVNGGRTIEESTLDHVWMTCNTRTKRYEEKRLEEFIHSKHIKIDRHFVKSPCGDVNDPHAYTLGALLGDGCSRQAGNNIYISSDSDVIKQWDRESCLKFLAGLIDTGGSVTFKNNCLVIGFECQAKSVAESVQFLIFQLFQRKCNLRNDGRDKYKNGQVWNITIDSNLFSKIALKELSQYIQTPRKQWKSKYENALENNTNKKYIGVSSGNVRKTRTWDLSIENETHIYLTANGLSTHNSFSMCTIGTEYCLRNPNQVVLLVFPKKKDAANVAKDHMRKILQDCPPHLTPEYMVADKTFIFPNGSEIRMCGTDGGSAESIRGTTVHLILMDEAGFHDYKEFQYIVTSIMIPTTTVTKGKIIMASTPSKEPDHAFMTNYVLPHREAGTLVEYDIYSNPMITEDMIPEIAENFPLGFDDPDFQREYLLKTNIANDSMVVPEFYDIKDDIVRDSEIPAYYDYYVSCDPAVTDSTGILFAYYDYLRKKLVIVDEAILGGEGYKSITTSDIAECITRKEKMHFTSKYTGLTQDPYLRVMDDNMPLLINDLMDRHGIQFFATKKQGKGDQIHKTRMMLKLGEIEIHPRCKILMNHIETAKWDKNHKSFRRNRGNVGVGIRANHSDLLDALIYMVRNFQPNKNPYPSGHFQLSGNNVHNREGDKLDDNIMSVINALTNKKINN